MAVDDPQKRVAASVLASGATQGKAAEAAGVHRSTIKRWIADEDFKELVAAERGDTSPDQTLESLVPLAHRQLKSSLDGSNAISAAQANIALSVLKAAAAIGRASPEGAAGSLASRLAELGQGTSD